MITLRPMTPADKTMVCTWRNQPEVARHMYTDHAITAEEHERWFASVLCDPRNRYWIIVHAGKDQGLACLTAIDLLNRRASWAFYLADPEQRGKSLGGFVEYAVLEHAFNELGLHKLCCEVLTANRTVLSLHERFGFRQEGMLREHIFKGGEFHDVICLAITRLEWETRRADLADLLTRIEARLARKDGGQGSG
jgi:UDP-4-amino-4,6-dideoxy-N-acetyl-beta-L-altrosamine N-acetyltransferase